MERRSRPGEAAGGRTPVCGSKTATAPVSDKHNSPVVHPKLHAGLTDNLTLSSPAHGALTTRLTPPD